MRSLPCFRAEKFVCCAVVLGIHYKLIQLIFQRRDGSVLVSFPYYEHSTGLVSMATLPAHGSQLDLRPGGKITSHLVKYAHHPDGEAHFSQDGKVVTAVRRQAVPLDDVGGHLFTVHIAGFDSFQILSERELATSPKIRRTTLNFDYGATTPRAIKIVARLFTTDSLTTEGVPPATPQPIMIVDRTGVERYAFLASPPSGRSGSHRIVVLTSEEWMEDHGGGPGLSFIGAFDPEKLARDVSQPTTVLALSYPIESAEELRARLGTIDLT